MQITLAGLPTSGHLGLFARVRGFGGISFALADNGNPVRAASLPLTDTGSGTAPFHPLELTPDIDLASVHGPMQVFVLLASVATLAQIDCVVPVITP